VAYARLDLLILDDWGLAPLTDEQRRDLPEVLDDRHGLRFTIHQYRVIMTSTFKLVTWR
jgi:DNA replication protein DnaC